MIKCHLCTISFRHELVSFRQLLRFAGRSGFSGIELWGVHGLALLRQPGEISYLHREMAELGIGIAMISDYLDLNADPAGYGQVQRKWEMLVRLASACRTNKIRIFAGRGGSASASSSDWERVAARTRSLADRASAAGIHTLIETHPGTYADRLDAVIRFMRDVNHPALGINLDILHLWESGTSPLKAWEALKPEVKHLHLKNILHADRLHVFAPENVYSPNGDRAGMVGLAEGAVDYLEVLRLLAKEKEPRDVSLEWFGNKPFHYLVKEIAWLKKNGLLQADAEPARTLALGRLMA
jgi:3-dehydroshikimate dehydratase